MFSKSAIVAAVLAGLASASPLVQRSVGTFNVVAIRSGSAIQYGSVNANGGKFWIGKPTSSYCPPTVEALGYCGPSNSSVTTFSSANTGTLSLSTIVPGGQQVYISNDFSLAYTSPHSASKPNGSTTDGFFYAAPGTSATSQALGYLTHGLDTFYACPRTTGNSTIIDNYQIYVFGGPDYTSYASCVPFSAGAVVANGTSVWEYV